MPKGENKCILSPLLPLALPLSAWGTEGGRRQREREVEREKGFESQPSKHQNVNVIII